MGFPRFRDHAWEITYAPIPRRHDLAYPCQRYDPHTGKPSPYSRKRRDDAGSAFDGFTDRSQKIRNTLNSRHRPRHPLSGLLTCGLCGAGYNLVGNDR